MSSSSSSSTISSAYTFKYFPRNEKWTKEMQLELDNHSRNMLKLMMHVQDLHKSKHQIEKDQQREDTDHDIRINALDSATSSKSTSSGSTSPVATRITNQSTTYYTQPMMLNKFYY